MQWSVICPAASLTFASAMYILKYIIFELDKKVLAFNKLDTIQVREVYFKIVYFIKYINEEFHIVMLMDTALILTIVFREMYVIFFSYHTEPDFIISRVIYVCMTFARYIVKCSFSSSVSNAIADLNFSLMETFHGKFQLQNTDYFFFSRKDSEVFTLLSSIPVSNGLILSTIGSILTYGFLIATFNIKESEEI